MFFSVAVAVNGINICPNNKVRRVFTKIVSFLLKKSFSYVLSPGSKAYRPHRPVDTTDEE